MAIQSTGMLKRITTAFYYYALEMVSLLTLLVAFLILGGESGEVGYLNSFITWLIFLFFTAMLPMLWINSQSTKTWLFIHIGLMLVCGFFIWSFSLATLAVLIAVPYWRMIIVFEEPMQQDLLIKRFIIFIGALLTAFFGFKAMYVGPQSDWIPLMTIVLLIQISLMGLGMLNFQYLKAREQSGVNLFQWIKNQATYFILLGSLALITGLIALAMPYIRQLLVNFLALTKDASIVVYMFLFSWWSPERQKISTDSQLPEGWGEYQERDIFGDALDAEQAISPLLNQIIAITLVSLVAVLVLFMLYRLISSLYLRQPGSSEAQSRKFEIDVGRKGFSSLFHRGQKWSWQSNPLRRKYQELLHIAHSKGQLVSVGSTAREWSQQATKIDRKNRELAESITRLNMLYEQIRYSKEETLSDNDLKVYEAEVKLLKREIKRLVKEKRRKEKG